MAKGKLLHALDRQKGRNIKLEKQREQEKIAAKKRAAKGAPQPQDEKDEFNAFDSESDSDEDALDPDNSTGGVPLSESIAALARGIAADAAAENGEVDEDEDEEDDEDPEAGEDIPFSDLESLGSDAKADVVPFQRLTINNTAALLKAHRALTASRTTTSFTEHQTVTSSAQVEINDVDDDLGRELAFYKQSLEAATEGRSRLRQAGVPFSRPTDYFAEMVKTDEHMDRIRAKLVEKETDKKAAAEARRLRDLKKFGKQVQVAKQQERDKAKRDTLDKINQLKRKRNASSGDTREEDLFDVALDETKEKPERHRRKSKNDAPLPNPKRQSKNEKYGQGGRKRFKKSGDAVSSGDLSGFSAKHMKGQTKGSKRLGKSRRTKHS